MVASPKKGKGHVEAQFTSEYVEQTREDTLPEKIKGTVVWVNQGENNGYMPIKYLEHLQKWTMIVQSKTDHQWFTLRLALNQYQTGQHRSNRSLFGITPDPSEQLPEDNNESEQPPQQNNPALDMLQTQITQASTSTTVPPVPLGGSSGGGAPAPGGGGGGGGGGGAPAPAKAKATVDGNICLAKSHGYYFDLAIGQDGPFFVGPMPPEDFLDTFFPFLNLPVLIFEWGMFSRAEIVVPYLSNLTLVNTSRKKDRAPYTKFSFSCQPDCSVYSSNSNHNHKLNSSLVKFPVEFKTTPDQDPFVVMPKNKGSMAENPFMSMTSSGYQVVGQITAYATMVMST
ncbi:hypothetical protein BJY52DRAFT_1228125 [Lactarius psammicola]|nr:hypothetical protein BJY52DRAFT_1228125 [Lactarius psammicola]